MDRAMFEYVGPPLTRQRLGAVLEANGVSDRAYDLHGRHKDDALVLDRRREGWVVFHSERGDENILGRHESESDACLDLLHRLLAHPHNRYELVAGPAPPADAYARFDAWLRARGLTIADLAERDYRTSDALYARGEPPSRSYFVRRKLITSHRPLDERGGAGSSTSAQ